MTNRRFYMNLFHGVRKTNFFTKKGSKMKKSTHPFQSHLYADGGGDVVVLHPHHDLLLHGQPRRLSHRGAHGVAHRVRRGPRQTDQDQVRLPGVRLHQGILQGKLGIFLFKFHGS
jgi:hypothetical protein